MTDTRRPVVAECWTCGSCPGHKHDSHDDDSPEHDHYKPLQLVDFVTNAVVMARAYGYADDCRAEGHDVRPVREEA